MVLEEFELRAIGITFGKICNQLKITKPTSINGESHSQMKLINSHSAEKRIQVRESMKRIDNKLLKGLEKNFIRKDKKLFT